MVWGLDSVVGSVQGLFSSTKSSAPEDGSPRPVSSNPLSATSSASAMSNATSSTSQINRSLLESSNQSPQTTDNNAPDPSSNDNNNYWLSARSRKQFTVFLAGASFLVLSTRITARALRRKYLQNFPAFYRPSNAPPANAVNGAAEALEALSVASVNVLASSVMVGGGLLWAFDVSSIHDLRRMIRGGLGVDGTGRSAEEVEEEFEEWIASTLDRKKRKEDANPTDAGLGIKDREEVVREWRNERGKPRSTHSQGERKEIKGKIQPFKSSHDD